MKQIIFVTDAWEPQVNGVVTAVEMTTRILKERGYEVTVIHPGHFKTFPLPLYPEIRLALFPYLRVQKILRQQPHAAIHIATEGPLGLAARRFCLKNTISFSTSYHTQFHLHLQKRVRGLTGVAYRFLRWFHAPATVTMVASQSLKDQLEGAGFRHLALWPLGVDTKLFTRNPSPQVLNLVHPVFGYFGRLAKEKSPEEFLKLDLPGTKLVIGDGPMRKELEARYGESAAFVGYKKGQGLVDHLSTVDVLVFPSRTETFGLVIVEALAIGIPVAAHAAMGPQDIIENGVDGYIDEDLQKAAITCLSLNRDNCRKKALLFSWERATDIFLTNVVTSH